MKERIDRFCPKCLEAFLMAEPWGDHGSLREFRVTCENFLACGFERHIHELISQLKDGKLAHERLDILLSEAKKGDGDAA